MHISPHSTLAAPAAFLAITVAVAHGGPPSVPYSGCGTLMPGIECPRFVGDDGTTFSIPGTGKFTLGDHVFVTGSICAECPSICQDGPVFETRTIEHCNMIPPSGHLFSECGVLVFTVGPNPCLVLQTRDDLLYLVENTGGFGPGDNVWVTTDDIIAPCITLCTATIEACLENNGIQPCIAPPLALDTCGTLIPWPIGTGFCTVFEADDGNRWILDNQGSFELGDRLHVTGPAFFCTPLCGEVVGCVINDPPVGCTGDVNSDGVINIDDLLAVIAAWGPCSCAEDVDGNGIVDIDDLLTVISNWPSQP